MQTEYFKSSGKGNTDRAFAVAKGYVQKHKVKSIIVASTTGYTARKAAEVFKDRNLIIVTHFTGMIRRDHQQFPSTLRKRLEAKGVKVLTTAHAFGGINKLFEQSVGSIIADTLRMFSEGTKVAVEIALMAADSGLVKTTEDVVVIAGTGKGADTVLVIKPANSTNLFDLRIKEVLAKPILN